MSDLYAADIVYTPVELGTIRIGMTRVAGERGNRLPVKLDHMLVTSLVRRDHQWLEHEMMGELRAQQHARDQEAAKRKGEVHDTPVAETKIRSIPIRLQFDDPELALNSRFEAFDRQIGRPVCASIGNGQAKRATESGSEVVECVGPDACPFANGSEHRSCRFFGRLSVQIHGQRQADNVFVLRTTSWNSIRTLASKLKRFHALFKGRLAGVPFRLCLRSRTTPGSKWGVFYFLDLDLDGVGLLEAAELANKTALERKSSDLLDWDALEAEVKAGLLNGRLNADPLEAELMEEFYLKDPGDEDGDAQPRAVTDEGGNSAQLVHLPGLTVPPRPGCAVGLQGLDAGRT